MAIKRRRTSSGEQKTTGELTKNQRWGYGLILLFIAFFLLVAVVSFFFNWRDDQSIALWSNIFDGEVKVANKAGKLGAVLANYIVAGWFGLFGICIPVILIILALRVMRYRPAFLRRSVRMGLILMILGSLVLGFLFGDAWHAFGTGLGGAHGILVARWLGSLLGTVGTGLLLLLAVLIFAVFVNRNTIGYLNRFGQGVLENSKKVGETVVSTASSVIRREEGEEEGNAADPEPVPGVETAEPEKCPRRRGTIEPNDEFTVHPPGNPEPALSGKKPRKPAVTKDENGFVIFDPSAEHDGELEAEEPQLPDGAVEVDDDGFIITNLSPEGKVIGSAEEQFSIRSDFSHRAPNDGSENFPATDSGSDPDRFVAHVPGSIDLGETDAAQIDVNYLPQDTLLAEEDIENRLYDPTLELSSYQRPPVELLEDHSVEVSVTSEEIVENKNRIKETLENFGIRIDKIKATIGPTVTLYEIVPAPGVRISKIKNLEDDIALSLSALGIRIIAPIPGKGTIGIEVPNKDKKVVSMSSVIRSVKFQESNYDIPVVLGKTIQDETFVIDLAKMPHLLVAGATGQGKSVGLNAIITSLLYKKHPAELKLVLVDPKKVELTLYSKLERHFLAKMPGEDDAIITDTHKVIYTLNSLCVEMDSRYDLLRKAEVRHIKEYNEKFTRRRLNPNKGHRFLPYIIVIIDEFADLIMTAGREVETPIARIAQLARAVGIHLVIATQRPTTNIITGVIKANFPARIAFRVTSMIDSRTIIDQPGANQLIGRGDMLVSTGNELIRVQCAFVDTPEIERIAEFIGNQRGYLEPYELPEYVPEGSDAGAGSRSNDLSQLDAMFEDVARFVVQNQQGSTSSIQRRFSIGYNRAGRIMDQLEMAGVVGRAEGSKPREVLITDMMSLERLFAGLDM